MWHTTKGAVELLLSLEHKEVIVMVGDDQNVSRDGSMDGKILRYPLVINSG